MKLAELHKHIVNKTFNDMYIFTGEEIAVQRIYINKIAELLGLTVEYVPEFKQIKANLQANNFFNTKKVFVILDDLDFVKQETLWQDFKTFDNIVIFKYNNLDKRTKFYKTFEDSLIDFEKLSSDMLVQYIQKELPRLTKNNCLELCENNSNSYSQILFEIDKIKQYMKATNEIDCNKTFDILKTYKTFNIDSKDILFDFVKDILSRDVKKTFEDRRLLDMQNGTTLKLLGLLYTNFRAILLIQTCKSKDICKSTGLAYYQVVYNEKFTNIYSTKELLEILELLRLCDKCIKTGKLREEIVLDYMLINIFKGGRLLWKNTNIA